MKDTEIIKALECCTSDKCTCSECPYEYTKHIKNEEFEVMSNGKSYDEWSCDEWLKCDLLDLINRQKEEIERLQERLKREAKCQYDLCGQIVDLKNMLPIARAEAVKEFAERLKVEMADKKYKYVTETNYSKTVNAVIDACIGATDNLVKEFTEDKADEDK